MSKYLVETFYTCSFKVKHFLDKIDQKELNNLEKREDGEFEIIDVKIDTRKTKSLEKNKITVNKEYFINGYRDNKEKTKKNIHYLLLKNKSISALFVSSHLFAMHVIDACSELNKKIGEDISLISFDSNILSILAPNITVVSQVAKETNEHFIKIINSKLL